MDGARAHPGPATPRMTRALAAAPCPEHGGYRSRRVPAGRKATMASHDLPGGVYRVGDLDLTRAGYGAMQLAGPGVFGPPKDRGAALAVLREAIALGVDHIDTCDYYGPHVTNQ